MERGAVMKGKRCQVCAGPVVNGRCKLCGMPYRNDEVLYHLNENKEKHYEHATLKAQEIMRQRQIPLGDQRKMQQGKAGQTLTKEQIRAQQERVRKEAMQKMTTTRVPVNVKKKKDDKKKSIPGLIWGLLILLYIILNLLME